jgi:hypothetical protein
MNRRTFLKTFVQSLALLPALMLVDEKLASQITEENIHGKYEYSDIEDDSVVNVEKWMNDEVGSHLFTNWTTTSSNGNWTTTNNNGWYRFTIPKEQTIGNISVMFDKEGITS